MGQIGQWKREQNKCMLTAVLFFGWERAVLIFALPILLPPQGHPLWFWQATGHRSNPQPWTYPSPNYKSTQTHTALHRLSFMCFFFPLKHWNLKKLILIKPVCEDRILIFMKVICFGIGGPMMMVVFSLFSHYDCAAVVLREDTHFSPMKLLIIM